MKISLKQLKKLVSEEIELTHNLVPKNRRLTNMLRMPLADEDEGIRGPETGNAEEDLEQGFWSDSGEFIENPFYDELGSEQVDPEEHYGDKFKNSKLAKRIRWGEGKKKNDVVVIKENVTEEELGELIRNAQAKSEELKKIRLYPDAEAMNYAELTTLMQKHEAAAQAWDQVIDALDDDYHNPERSRASDQRLVHEDFIYDLDGLIKDAQERDEKATQASTKLKELGLRLLTLKDVESVYRAAKSEYSSSYAMMVDDAWKGANNVASTLGLSCCYDSGWFSTMFGYIRAHKSWTSIPEYEKKNLLEDMNEDLVKHPEVPRKAKKVKPV